MQSYTLNRPDGALLCRVLEQHTNDAAGAILRLAWMAGLMRDEIQHLTWAQVDLLGEQLLLPDRAVPLAPELAAWLEALRRERNGSSERVVLSDRDQQPLAAQSISRLARAALDAGDLKAVRLIDLRHDYVLRQLERHDWQYVSRITGLEAAAMNVHFAAYLTEKKVSTRIRRKAAPPEAEWVLMSPRSRRPYERTRLSKLVRAALVQGGLDDLSLRDLRLDYDIRVGGENQVLDVVRRQGSITRNEVIALLRVSKNTAYNRLRQMVARGKLTKVGNRYYLPSTVVPPEDQEQAILAYLSEAGFAYRQDIARVLRIGPRQCWPILQRMLAEHQIAKDGQKYILLQKEA